MALFDDSEDRTYAPTTYRREQFRREGSVALSREVLSIVMLATTAVTLYLTVPMIKGEFKGVAEFFFAFEKWVRFPEFGKDEVLGLRETVLKASGKMAGPVLVMAMLFGIFACIAQVGFLVSFEALGPKWERLNPLEGFQRIFSKHGLVEGLKSVIKIALATYVVYRFLKGELFNLNILYQKSTAEIAEITISDLFRLAMSLVLFLGVIAALDYLFQRLQHEKQLKMTRREAKEEMRLREGDPLIRSRIRSAQKRIAGRKMMEDVPKSTVVVTNPTHIAIALLYESKMDAPKVVAKGAGVIADKIREIARFNQVPIVENKPLARTMFKTVKIGQHIPKELYKAVAQVLSYVYKLKRIRMEQASAYT